MLTSTIVTIVGLIFFIFFIFYKRSLLMRIFSINTIEPANQFKQQLEQTADEIIGRMESKISELEYLLDMADEKIKSLEEQMKMADGETTLIYGRENRILSDENIASYKENECSHLEPTQKFDIEEYADKQENLSNTAKLNPEDEDRRKLVLAMAEQGYNITDISRATGKGKGEIMLLLQLHKR